MSLSDTLAEYAARFEVCTDFAGAYARENDNVVIKYGEVDGAEHCWVYDRAEDATIDATLSQFAGFVAGCETDDWFPGDEHPVADELAEFETLEAFAEGPGGTYLLDE